MRLLPFLLIACGEAPPPPPIKDAGFRDAGFDDASIDAGDDAGTACTEEDCAHLDRNPTCGTGTAAGFLVDALGVCATGGCAREWRSIEDCRGPSRTYCGDGVILQDVPTCMTSSCAIATSIERECTAPPDRCEGNTFHFGAQAECSGDPPSCGFTEQTEACTASDPTCSAGFITAYTAGCDPSLGCTETATIASCFDPNSSCAGNILTSYAPACEDASTCGSPIATMTTCTGHNECNGRVFAAYAPRCNAAADRCEETLTGETDCGYLDDCFCTGVPPAATQTIVTGFCTVQSGCDFATSPPVACPNTCSCSPRVCN